MFTLHRCKAADTAAMSLLLCASERGEHSAGVAAALTAGMWVGARCYSGVGDWVYGCTAVCVMHSPEFGRIFGLSPLPQYLVLAASLCVVAVWVGFVPSVSLPPIFSSTI